MINISDVVTYLQAQTTFIVDEARSVQPSLEYVATPLVYVGYSSLRSTIADNQMDVNEYNLNGEGMVQVIETQLVCPASSFYSNFKILYKTLNQYNPIPEEAYRTAIAYLEGGVIGLDNGIQRHLDRWRIGFSTVANDF